MCPTNFAPPHNVAHRNPKISHTHCSLLIVLGPPSLRVQPCTDWNTARLASRAPGPLPPLPTSQMTGRPHCLARNILNDRILKTFRFGTFRFAATPFGQPQMSPCSSSPVASLSTALTIVPLSHQPSLSSLSHLRPSQLTLLQTNLRATLHPHNMAAMVRCPISSPAPLPLRA